MPTDSERFLGALNEMALRAAGWVNGSPTPEQLRSAAEAVDWLRNRAHQPRGINPGWGGKPCYVIADASPRQARYQRIYFLRRNTLKTFIEIADDPAVLMSPDRVAHVCFEAGVKKGECIT